MAGYHLGIEPHERVSVNGRDMTLREAVRQHAEARKKAPRVQVVPTVAWREIGKDPATLGPADLDRLAEVEEFR